MINWRSLGIFARTNSMSFLNPISKSLSASSKTTASHFEQSISFCLTRSIKRPGVATMTWGFPSRISFCLSMLSPPITQTVFTPNSFPIKLNTLSVCWASSLVGLITKKRPFISFSINFWIIGIANEPVLPLPVSAWAKISSPARIVSRVISWMGEGWVKPIFSSALIRLGSSLKSVNANILSIVLLILDFSPSD